MSAEVLDLSAMLPGRHREVLRCLGLLSRRVDPERWCVVGGLMVMIAGQSVGATDRRSIQTKDGDIVIDVVADPGALERVFRELTALGYEPPPEAFDDAKLARCSVLAGSSAIDILAPEDASPDQLDVGPDVRSLAIPGGRRALEVARPLLVTYDQDAPDVAIRIPDVYGAIAVKAAAAVDERTSHQPRHVQDVAFLLSAVDDPRTAASILAEDVADLQALQPTLQDAASTAWEYLDGEARLRALTTLDFVLA